MDVLELRDQVVRELEKLHGLKLAVGYGDGDGLCLECQVSMMEQVRRDVYGHRHELFRCLAISAFVLGRDVEEDMDVWASTVLGDPMASPGRIRLAQAIRAMNWSAGRDDSRVPTSELH